MVLCSDLSLVSLESTTKLPRRAKNQGMVEVGTILVTNNTQTYELQYNNASTFDENAIEIVTTAQSDNLIALDSVNGEYMLRIV